MIRFHLDFSKFTFLFFISYFMLFYIPITSKEYYYNINYFHFLLNNKVLFISYIIIFTKIFTSLLKFPLKSPMLFLISIAMILHNLILYFFGVDSNFFVTGFLLLLYPLSFLLTHKLIVKVIELNLIILILFWAATVFDNLTIYNISPISEIRYYLISEETSEFRFQNNSLYGQKNSLGATLSIMILIYLYASYYFYILNFWRGVLVSLSSALLLASNSAAGIGILLCGIFILLILKKKIIFSLIFLLLTILYLFNFQVYNIQYKLDSLFLKLNTNYSFFDWKDPLILIFGHRVLGSGDIYTESTFLDMILNFGIFIPLLFLSYLLFRVFQNIIKGSFFLAYIYVAIIFLILLQNSSLMPASIFLIIFLEAFCRYPQPKVAHTSK
jgi:hypothetical protein